MNDNVVILDCQVSRVSIFLPMVLLALVSK